MSWLTDSWRIRAVFSGWLCVFLDMPVAAIEHRGTPVLGGAISSALRRASPRWQFSIPAEDNQWPVEQERKRWKTLRGTRAYYDDITKIMTDDSPDTYLYRNYSEIPWSWDAKSPSYFWEALCNGTKVENKTNATNASKPLDGWNVVNTATCVEEDQLGEGFEYDDELKARMMCGTQCAAVLDVGCSRTKFKLCKMGFKEETNGTTNCLRWRLPDHKPYESIPRPPQKPAFWKQLCEHMHTPFQKLFRLHLCSATMTTLDGPTSELECAEATVNKTDCADMFDYQPGPPKICRCMPAGGNCDPSVLDSGAGDVYMLAPWLKNHSR